MRKCPVCEKGDFRKVKDIIVKIKNKSLKVRGERCDFCNEEFPSEEGTKKILDNFK